MRGARWLTGAALAGLVAGSALLALEELEQVGNLDRPFGEDEIGRTRVGRLEEKPRNELCVCTHLASKAFLSGVRVLLSMRVQRAICSSAVRFCSFRYRAAPAVRPSLTSPIR